MWISCTLISKSEITSHNWEQRGWRSQDCAARLLSAEARTFWLLLLWDFLLALDRASVNVLMDCEVFCVLCWIRSRDINESVSIKLCKSFRNHCRPVTSEERRPVARSPRPSPPTRAIIRSCHAVTLSRVTRPWQLPTAPWQSGERHDARTGILWAHLELKRF